MVTAYYIMNLSNNKKIFNVEEYYSSLQSKPKLTAYEHSTCRVCLQSGDIPIFGAENAQDIIDALKTFGEIDDLNEENDNPKHLCNICFKFIRSAILFRFIAQRTNETLKSPIQSPEYIHIEDDDKLDTLLYEDFPSPAIPPKVSCPICKRMFVKDYIKQHMKLHNSKNKDIIYVCETCGKSFHVRMTYYKHKLRHATDYNFICKYCPYKARYVDSLNNHMKTHYRRHKHMCTECPAIFLHRSNLNHHILTHHREPEYKCDSCEKAFHTKLSLERHYDYIHLGIKRHVCEFCNKQYGYRTAMMKHQLKVHKREKVKFHFNHANYIQISDD